MIKSKFFLKNTSTTIIYLVKFTTTQGIGTYLHNDILRLKQENHWSCVIQYQKYYIWPFPYSMQKKINKSIKKTVKEFKCILNQKKEKMKIYFHSHTFTTAQRKTRLLPCYHHHTLLFKHSSTCNDAIRGLTLLCSYFSEFLPTSNLEFCVSQCHRRRLQLNNTEVCMHMYRHALWLDSWENVTSRSKRIMFRHLAGSCRAAGQ